MLSRDTNVFGSGDLTLGSIQRNISTSEAVASRNIIAGQSANATGPNHWHLFMHASRDQGARKSRHTE